MRVSMISSRMISSQKVIMGKVASGSASLPGPVAFDSNDTEERPGGVVKIINFTFGHGTGTKC
jgi:hypothetical protein